MLERLLSDISPEVARLLDEAFATATRVLEQNRPVLLDAAAELISKETLSEAQLAVYRDRLTMPPGIGQLETG